MKFRIFLLVGVFLILGIVALLSQIIYQYYRMAHLDDPITPTIMVLEGGAKIIRGEYAIELIQGESYDLEVSDSIETGLDSLAMITWPDHSITRLGSASRIGIQKMLAEKGYQNIQISFSLEKGKIWSTVVRSLIGESYFETHLPENNIVAGVRGTTYEIHLEDHYIHAIHHAISLRDSSQKTTLLMPGDIVDSNNIWLRLRKEVLDTTWSRLNTTYDTKYLNARAASLQSGLNEQSDTFMAIIRTWIRSVLKHFQAFEILSIEDSLKSGDIKALSEISPDALVSYYQRIQGGNDFHDKDTLRNALYEAIIVSGSGANAILESLRIGSFWDTMDTGNMLPGAEKILNTGSKTIEGGLKNLQKILQERDITEEIQDSLKNWLQ